MTGVTTHTVTANTLSITFDEAGSGPLVLFCHGWPEGRSSWRRQLAYLGARGFRCVAPDMRGYGDTEAPAAIERYSILDLVADQVALVAALGEKSAVIVGHDWGAPVAWHCALLRPDVFPAVVGMSLPWAVPGKVDLVTSLENQGIQDFYIQYFQAPGVAEAELDRDPEDSLLRIYFTGSGEQRDRTKGFTYLGTGGLLDNTVRPVAVPAWLGQDHFDHLVDVYRRTGFRGGLNWYRNLARNWRLTQPWRGEPIRQPSLFIAGAKDGVLRFPAAKGQIEAFPKTLPGCRGVHIIPEAGHWIQQERADEVNALLETFLKSL